MREQLLYEQIQRTIINVDVIYLFFHCLIRRFASALSTYLCITTQCYKTQSQFGKPFRRKGRQKRKMHDNKQNNFYHQFSNFGYQSN